MGLLDFLRRLLGGGSLRGGVRRRRRKRAIAPGKELGADELARRLGIGVDRLRAVTPTYRRFTVPKRSGGQRTLFAPDPELKQLQRTLLRRLLSRLKSHPTVTGFERGHSIATNGAVHVGAAVVVRMDLRDFFHSTQAGRVRDHFHLLGWNAEACALLVKLCTHQGGLPQGAPTSPRLSNLVNWEMDARLEGAARGVGATYTRYADDLTFSFPSDDHESVRSVIQMTKKIVGAYGYLLHTKRKLSIRRRHQRQQVTGLVVNERVALPRRVRRWLRAVEHHTATGKPASLTSEQLTGWRALQHMIETQRGGRR